MTSFALVYRLLLVRLRSAGNVVRTGGKGSWLLVWLLLLLVAGLLYGEYRFFLTVFVRLDQIDSIPRFFLIGVLGRLHNMIFMTAFSMMLFSNLISSVSTCFLAKDLPLLHSSPAPSAAIFASQLIETLMISSYMVWLMTTPIFTAFGAAYGSALRTTVWTLSVLLVYSVPPALMGSLVALWLMRFIPARRAHQFLTGLGLLGGVLLVTLLRALRPERLLDPKNGDDFIALLSSISIPAAFALPSTWASNAVVASIQGLHGVFAAGLLKICLLSLPLLIALYASVRKIYVPAYARASESVGKVGKGRKAGASRLERFALGRRRKAQAVFLLKDLRIFARDSAQWSQLLLIAALIFVYLFNIRHLPYVAEFPWLRIVVSYMNLSLTGFILAAVAVRYAYPAVSLEGRSYWLIRSAPIRLRSVVLTKFFLHFFPFLLLSEALVISGQLFLSRDPFMLILWIATTSLIALGLTGLGVGMGAAFPRFRHESAAKIAMGAGGISFMALALAYVGAVLLLLAVPVWTHLKTVFPGFDLIRFEFPDSRYFYGGTVLLTLVVTVVPLTLGIRRLTNREA